MTFREQFESHHVKGIALYVEGPEHFQPDVAMENVEHELLDAVRICFQGGQLAWVGNFDMTSFANCVAGLTARKQAVLMLGGNCFEAEPEGRHFVLLLPLTLEEGRSLRLRLVYAL